MRILYVCGTYCPSYGGAEISMHTLLKQLQKKFGVEVVVMTDFRYTQNRANGEYEGVELVGIDHENRERKLQELIDILKPNLIITQLMWSDIALKISKINKIPCILRVCKIPFNLDIHEGSDYSPTAIIAISEAAKEYVKNNWGRESKIMFPAIEFDKVLIPKNHHTEKEYITMFNPLTRKGGAIFKSLTKKFPEKKFAVVYGWSSLKNDVDSKEFSDDLIRKICESLGIEFTGKKPMYTDLTDCNNITILQPTEDVWKIYAKTRILLVPSQWEEAFGRVAIEGMVNNIPVIASNVAGLEDAIGNGGILIKDYTNVEEWAKELIKLDDLDYYEKIAKNGINWVEKNYSLKQIIEDSLNFFNNIVRSYKL
jgi:glycosyltransferase involved in cell wall biosynthesis